MRELSQAVYRLHKFEGVRMEISRAVVLYLLASLASSTVFAQVRQDWVSRYDGPANSIDIVHGIAVDPQGNSYVTGSSPGLGTSYDYATVKYDANGNQLWVARFNGIGNGSDFPAGIVIDSLGNAYVSGASFNGVTEDIVTIKYDTNGNQVWLATFGTPFNNSVAYALAIDAASNIYVTGYSDFFEFTHTVTIKYDTNGNQIWSSFYDGSFATSNAGRAITVDVNGNVYVTGLTCNEVTDFNSCSRTEAVTIKYDSNGTQLWNTSYPGDARFGSASNGIAVDSTGNIYVAANTYTFATMTDYATIKYDPNGNQLWVKRYNGPANGEDIAQAIALDSLGNVLVTGTSCNDTQFFCTNSDFATIEYDPTGTQLWVSRYNGGSPGQNVPSALALDPTGNVYVTGGSELVPGNLSSFDYATVKYDQTGLQLWTIRYNGPANDYDSAKAIGLDADGNVYVTGSSCGSGPLSQCLDYATIKYIQK